MQNPQLQKELNLFWVIDTKPLLQRGVALDRNAAGKTVQLSDDWFKEVGRRLGKDNEAYKAIVEARELGTLSKVIAVPDRANKMVNLVKVNVPNQEGLLLLKKKTKLTE